MDTLPDFADWYGVVGFALEKVDDVGLMHLEPVGEDRVVFLTHWEHVGDRRVGGPRLVATALCVHASLEHDRSATRR